jgi:hypothetical protein
MCICARGQAMAPYLRIEVSFARMVEEEKPTCLG